jgi:hypothetical protein
MDMNTTQGLALILGFILISAIFIGGYALGYREGMQTGKQLGYRRGAKSVSA